MGLEKGIGNVKGGSANGNAGMRFRGNYPERGGELSRPLPRATTQTEGDGDQWADGMEGKRQAGQPVGYSDKFAMRRAFCARETGLAGLARVTESWLEGSRKGRDGGSTQWKHVSGFFPHNGKVFREIFHTMEACFGQGGAAGPRREK